jgi:hypothetical protein
MNRGQRLFARHALVDQPRHGGLNEIGVDIARAYGN